MPKVTAVCSVCQRSVHSGAALIQGTYLMVPHPSPSVQINVRLPQWDALFVETAHMVCGGSGHKPELVFDETTT